MTRSHGFWTQRWMPGGQETSSTESIHSMIAQWIHSKLKLMLVPNPRFYLKDYDTYSVFQYPNPRSSSRTMELFQYPKYQESSFKIMKLLVLLTNHVWHHMIYDWLCQRDRRKFQAFRKKQQSSTIIHYEIVKE